MGFSLKDFIENPSLLNGAFLAWDIAAAVLPYVPGAYSARGIKLVGKTDDVIDVAHLLGSADNLENARSAFLASKEHVVGSYSEIKKLVKSLDVKGVEVHHLIEKRFADNLGIDHTKSILSVALDKDTHRTITGMFCGKIPYSTRTAVGLHTKTAKPQQIWETIVSTYKSTGFEEYLPIIKQWIIDNANNARQIYDWMGW